MTKRRLDEKQVVDAAARLADSEGLDALTLTRLARELDVRQPALYRHVDSFDGLIRSLGLIGREVLAADLGAAAIGVSRDEAVEAVGLAWRRMAREHPGIYAATDRYPCAGDQELEQAVERVVGILGQALAGYRLDPDQRVHAARTLRSAFHGFAHLEAGDGHPLSQDLDDSFHQMIHLICAGIQSMETGAETPEKQTDLQPQETPT